MKHSLLIIGPDIQKHGMGGVTIHVQRLKEYLEKNGIEYEFKDYKSNSLWALMRMVSEYDIIHFHVSNPIYQFVLVLLSRLMGKRIVMTLHGNYGRFGIMKNGLVKSAIRMADVPIVINRKSFDACNRINTHTCLIPAFIPPQKEETLQKDVQEMIEHYKLDGKMIVSTNASNTATDKHGNDVYGIGFLIQYFKDSADAILVISDPSGNYRRRYEGLTFSSVCFIDYPHPYFQLLKFVDCFVRNTSTDGDALSVKEALYLGVPVLCSDVVDRPEGVQLFKYSDKNSFEYGLKCLSRKSVTVSNGAEMIVCIYNSLDSRELS